MLRNANEHKPLILGKCAVFNSFQGNLPPYNYKCPIHVSYSLPVDIKSCLLFLIVVSSDEKMLYVDLK